MSCSEDSADEEAKSASNSSNSSGNDSDNSDSVDGQYTGINVHVVTSEVQICEVAENKDTFDENNNDMRFPNNKNGNKRKWRGNYRNNGSRGYQNNNWNSNYKPNKNFNKDFNNNKKDGESSQDAFQFPKAPVLCLSYNNKKDNKGKKNKKQKNDIFKEVKLLWRENTYHPLNSWVLYLHHRLSVIIFLIAFLVISKSLFQKKNITCVDGFNADKSPDSDMLNICLSYSFIEIGDNNDGERKYLLSYRFMEHIFIALSILFYVPMFLMKIGNLRFQGLTTDLHSVSTWYRTKNYEDIRKIIIEYFEQNIGTHRPMFCGFVFNHLLCVIISCASFLFLDFVLQGNFWMIPSIFPFIRNPMMFKDDLSQIFPPFTKCKIGPPMNMHNARTEEYFCHLVNMELYEKLFIFLWFFLVTLICLGTLTILFQLVVMLIPPFRGFFLATKLITPKLKNTKKILLAKLNFGDIFCLYLIKELVSDLQFCKILEDLLLFIEKKEMTNAQQKMEMTNPQQTDNKKMVFGENANKLVREHRHQDLDFVTGTDITKELEALESVVSTSGIPQHDPYSNNKTRRRMLESSC